ncbi:MAG: hypothetical protein WC447_00420 [Candidatus Paceibacterota bacterium]|jgi:amino acid transporter
MKKFLCGFVLSAVFILILCTLGAIAGGNSSFSAKHSLEQLGEYFLFLVMSLAFLGLYFTFLDNELKSKLKEKGELKIIVSGYISVLFLLLFLIGEHPIRTNKYILIIITIIGIYNFIVSSILLISKKFPRRTLSENGT